MGGSGIGTPITVVGGATSGVTSFSVTRNDIILMAYEDMGVYAPGFELPTAGQIDTANKRLNMMIKAWQGQGVGLWLNKVGTLSVLANRQSYNLGPSGDLVIPKPLSIIECRRVDTDGNEVVMFPMSRTDYMALPLKSSAGQATQYYYDRQLVNGVLYIWQVESDLTVDLKFTYRSVVEDFVTLEDAPDFPQEWFDALHFNLALRLCPAFKVKGDQYGMIKEQAGVTLADADGFDREQETSIRFAPSFSR